MEPKQLKHHKDAATNHAERYCRGHEPCGYSLAECYWSELGKPGRKVETSTRVADRGSARVSGDWSHRLVDERVHDSPESIHLLTHTDETVKPARRPFETAGSAGNAIEPAGG